MWTSMRDSMMFEVRNVVPVPEGSHSAHIIGGRAVVHHNNSNKLMEYREAVADAYRKSGGNYHHDSPISIQMCFIFPRPKTVKQKKRPYMTVKPDLDKLIRSTLDALTGVAYDDDSQVIDITSSKIYDDYSDYYGVEIFIDEAVIDND